MTRCLLRVESTIRDRPEEPARTDARRRSAVTRRPPEHGVWQRPACTRAQRAPRRQPGSGVATREITDARESDGLVNGIKIAIS
jgi:hypothetical protein